MLLLLLISSSYLVGCAIKGVGKNDVNYKLDPYNELKKVEGSGSKNTGGE